MSTVHRPNNYPNNIYPQLVHQYQYTTNNVCISAWTCVALARAKCSVILIIFISRHEEGAN